MNSYIENDHPTQAMQTTQYISVKIIFIDEGKLVKIKKPIGENGVCNIDKISHYWSTSTYKNENFKPKSSRIQVCVNRNDLSIRLLNPYCCVWSASNNFTFFEENDINDVKKNSFKNEGKKIWINHAGSTTGLNIKGEIYAYPKKVKITFKLKEKNGNFKEEVEVRSIKNIEGFIKEDVLFEKNKNDSEMDTGKHKTETIIIDKKEVESHDKKKEEKVFSDDSYDEIEKICI